MKNVRLLIVLFCVSAVTSAGSAMASPLVGTVIQVLDKGQQSNMLTDGRQARIDMPGGEYALVDLKKHTIKVINPDTGQVMQLSAKPQRAGSKNGRNSAASSDLKLRKMASGGKVAGYAADSYEYGVKNRRCGTILASKEALQVQGVSEMLEAMSQMIASQRAMLGSFAALMDECRLADMQLTGKIASIGVPMRKIENGQVVTEVKSIKTGVALPADSFLVPSGYQAMNVNQQLQQLTQPQAHDSSGSPAGDKPSRSQISNKRSSGSQASTGRAVDAQAANVQEMVRQLQQSGQMTPQMMEQMRRTQGMIQQYRRPAY